MNEDKMSSSEVPGKFADWLLAMGCPPEKIPSMDKVAQMCRGQYYMAWRSLMEHVEAKDQIRQKRLQVFYDDVRRCQQAHTHDGSVLVPLEVSLWRRQRALRAGVAEAEDRVAAARGALATLTDKLAGKLAARRSARHGVAAAQARAWLLQTLADQLRDKRQSLLESREIAATLCRRASDTNDVKERVEHCLAALLRQPVSTTLRPAASSSLVSTSGETVDTCEESLSVLGECGAHEVWRELRVRRAALVHALAAADDAPPRGDGFVTPQCITARTAALHCHLALAAVKHRLQVAQTQQRLADALEGINDLLTSESCELLVLRCEQARAEGRVGTLKRLLEDVTSRRGVFAVAEGEPLVDGRGTAARAAQLHRALITKKEDTIKLLATLTKTERKIQSVRDSLAAIFNGFQRDLDECRPSKGCIQLVDLPRDPVVSVRWLYRSRLDRRFEQSLRLDGSTGSTGSVDDSAWVAERYMLASKREENSTEPTFIDELRFFLKNFCLEKNRKLVLDSGDKIWIFETLQASVGRFHGRCLTDDVTCALLCPSFGLRENLQRLCDVTERRKWMESLALALETPEKEAGVEVDISQTKAQEEQQLDKIKKRLNDSIQILQKTTKTLDLGKENLSLWSQNLLRRHISSKRAVGGKSYREYESLYLLEAADPAV